MPRRHVPWSDKVFYPEQSKRKVLVEAKWREGIFFEIKDKSEIAVVGTPHGFFSRSIRRVSKEDSGDGMLFGLQPGAEGGVVNRVQLDVQAAISEREAPPPTQDVEFARYGYTDRCIGCQHARLVLKLADHNEECRARIVRHMTADDNLNQRVQIAQDRTVESALLKQELMNEILYQSQHERRSDSRGELKNKHQRVLMLQIHGVPAAVRAVQAAVPVRILLTS